MKQFNLHFWHLPKGVIPYPSLQTEHTGNPF
jgi:hypothetical protein